jgi:hypothetical protein
MTSDRAARAADADLRAAGAPPGLAGLGPGWRLHVECWRLVRRHVHERRERLRCYACLVGSLAVNGHGVRLLLEPFGGLDRRLGALASDVRQGALDVARGARVAELRQR